MGIAKAGSERVQGEGMQQNWKDDQELHRTSHAFSLFNKDFFNCTDNELVRTPQGGDEGGIKISEVPFLGSPQRGGEPNSSLPRPIWLHFLALFSLPFSCLPDSTILFHCLMAP